MSEFKIIMSAVIFFGILSLLLLNVAFDTARIQGLTNQTNNANSSLVVIGSGGAVTALCQSRSTFPVVGGIIDGSSCVVDYIGFIFGFGGYSSTVPWLAIIIVGIIAGLIYVAVRLLKPFG